DVLKEIEEKIRKKVFEKPEDEAQEGEMPESGTPVDEAQKGKTEQAADAAPAAEPEKKTGRGRKSASVAAEDTVESK
ncbi:MAG: hypothetical protein IJ733_21240, partial [Lachnospiraceae bacterium]|nr:hypothetical protein [Lachnospiraceae bacterium]